MGPLYVVIYLMHIPASPLALPTDLEPSTDLVSLSAAVSLSTVAVVAAAIKASSCFLQPRVKPWLLLISVVSLGSFAGLLGVVSAGIQSM